MQGVGRKKNVGKTYPPILLRSHRLEGRNEIAWAYAGIEGSGLDAIIIERKFRTLIAAARDIGDLFSPQRNINQKLLLPFPSSQTRTEKTTNLSDSFRMSTHIKHIAHLQRVLSAQHLHLQPRYETV